MFYQMIRNSVLIDSKRLASGLSDFQAWLIVGMLICSEYFAHFSSVTQLLEALGQTFGWMHMHGASWEAAMATAVFLFALAVVIAGQIGAAATVAVLAKRFQ